LGDHADIGWGCFIHAGVGVDIGERVEIGGGTFIYSVSTIDGKRGQVVIGDYAKIGANSVIMPGVTIGEGAVVGAMSFVNKDVPAGCTVVGVPARRIE
jgi:acetyltransferase-like isoleucine patch superfamily enzyme